MSDYYTPLSFEVVAEDGEVAVNKVAVRINISDEDVNDVFSIDEVNTGNVNITITLDPLVTGNYRVTLDDVFYVGNNQGTPSVGSLSEQEQLRSDYLVIIAD